MPTGLSDEIQRALGALPDDFRVPVVLCDVSDLSYEQIAEVDRRARRHRSVAHRTAGGGCCAPRSSPTG